MGQPYLQHEQQQPEVVRAPPLAEQLHRREVAAALAERPDARAHEIEDHRRDQPGRRGHQGEDPDALAVGLGRGAEQGEGRHVGAEQRHQQDHRPERAGGDEVVLAGAAEEAVAEQADDQHGRQVADDDREGHGGFKRSGIPPLPGGGEGPPGRARPRNPRARRHRRARRARRR